MEQRFDWSTCPGVEIDPRRQSGAPIFSGTRVPIDVVLNNIHDGGSPAEIDEILGNFPVTHEQVITVLTHIRQYNRVLSRA
jgi:uncharacterized protein (DUF433 family)